MSERAHVKTSEALSSLIAPAAHTSKFVHAGDLKLHYLDYGTERLTPMLCVHGGAAHAHWFDFVAADFAAHYHVRALDLRGHGDSDWIDPPAYSYHDYAADVAKVVEKLDLRDFVLIGHSMGGLVSLIYAATFPGKVSRLVIVDTTMHMSTDGVARLRDLGARPSRDYATREELIARYRLEPVGPKLASPEVVRHVARHSGRKTADGTWRHKFDRSLYAIFERVDGMPYWDQIRIPTLLMKGEHSNRVSADVLSAVKARSPHVELVEVPDSDHHITLDNPAGFVRSVTAFLDRTSRR
jgi:pimeloyl-ACP methyl ester carboxylesterase